ncbi:MAG: hypothetical protein JSU86_16645 [Phycisphaerales bacterium]|nr:MAG: hypothetical protein JSU86_16645 [Phycisphaerales bacterium]
MFASKTVSLCLVFLASLTICGQVLASPFFALVGWRGEFARIDATTGEVYESPQTVPPDLNALALSPGGVLYAGPGEERDLFTLDPMDGAAQHALSIDSDIRGMAFSPEGDLYVAARDEQLAPTMLRIISLADGSHTDVGALSGVGMRPQGLAFSPDGQLYMVRPNADEADLFTVNPDNAELQFIGSHTGLSHQGITFAPDGSLYAVGYSEFVQLDPGNGAVIGDVVELSGDYRGVAFIPEPATAVMLSLISLGLLGRRMLRRNRST